MVEIANKTDLLRARKVALYHQGLSQAKPFGNGNPGIKNALKHLGYIQIDTISVVERAHHHVLHSRVPSYKTSQLNKLLEQRHIFEYWSHAAAFLPMADFRFSLPFKNAIKGGRKHWQKHPDYKLMAKLLKQIEKQGPLKSSQIETQDEQQNPAQPAGAGWWSWKPAKKALEQLYMQGDLMISSRSGFQKTYDLSERVLAECPFDVDTTPPSYDEFAEHLINQQLNCHGLVTLKGVSYLRRDAKLRSAVKKKLIDKRKQGSVEQFELSNQIFFSQAGALEKKYPRTNANLHILSPFDNIVIQRDRLKLLFGFDYQIECYVPAAKRKIGYFGLPLLFRNEFIGQMDCKAHRKNNVLELIAIHLNTGKFSTQDIYPALAKRLALFIKFQGMKYIKVSNIYLHDNGGKITQQALASNNNIEPSNKIREHMHPLILALEAEGLTPIA